jgi:hypothetical protein
MSGRDLAIEASAVGCGDWRPDFSREEDAFLRERERLVRDHGGEYALVHHNEVVGVFSTFREAVLEAGRRFELGEIMVRDISDPEGPAQIPHVDVNHPAFRLNEASFTGRCRGNFPEVGQQ